VYPVPTGFSETPVFSTDQQPLIHQAQQDVMDFSRLDALRGINISSRELLAAADLPGSAYCVSQALSHNGHGQNVRFIPGDK